VLDGLALARATMDRAGERWTDEAWIAQRLTDPRTRALRVHDGRVPVRDSRLALVPVTSAGPGTTFLLGVDEDDVAYVGVLTESAIEEADGVQALDLRAVGSVLDDREVGLVVHAVALGHWHATHACCARCGQPTEVIHGGHVRRCPSCGAEHYPRTDPAIIVLVTDAQGRALLGHNPRWPDRRFSTLAGFVEPGESAEMAVAREVSEEAGVEVTEVSYLGSQPWPFPHSLMLGFTARALAPATVHVDGVEITEARWFSREELAEALARGEVLIPPGISIARRLIEHWYGGPLPGGRR